MDCYGSGCGKSTLLRCIAGLIHPTEGTICMKQDITKTTPNQRGVGLVFQDYALFPTCTIRKTCLVEYLPLQHALSFFGLTSELNRLPSQLSGGQQQRVALARALAAKPNCCYWTNPSQTLMRTKSRLYQRV